MRALRSEALALADPRTRRLALEKLDGERFNAEAAAMAATIAPRHSRRQASAAIVTLEVMFDYLDGLTERPLHHPIQDGERLHAALLAALRAPRLRREGREARVAGEDAYLQALSQIARAALAQLPSWEAVEASAIECAQDAIQAQVRMHAASSIGTAELETWALSASRSRARDAQPTGGVPQPTGRVPWRDFAAGAACSVLTLHALIAAAAQDATTRSNARSIQTAYSPLCTAITLLDCLIDAPTDGRSATLGYASLYEDQRLIRDALRHSVTAAIDGLSTLSRSRHHLMMLASAIAYEVVNMDRNRQDGPAALVRALAEEHRSLLLSPIVVLRAWRLFRGSRSRPLTPLATARAPQSGQRGPARAPKPSPNRERTSTC